jgi:outer membrane protein assembly factor BamB
MDHTPTRGGLSNGQLWEIDLDGPMLHAPVLDADGILYLTTLNEEVIAVNTASQRVVWREPIVGKVWNPPLLHEGTLYFGTDEKKTYAVDAATGATNWTNDAGSAIIAAPVLFGDSIAFTEGGEVFTKSTARTVGHARSKASSIPLLLLSAIIWSSRGSNSSTCWSPSMIKANRTGPTIHPKNSGV